MKKLFIMLLDWLLVPKAKVWLQGKKTYAVNITQALIGVGGMLATSGQMLDLVVKSISLVLGWSDPASLGPQMPTGDAYETLQALWRNHAVLTAAFSASLYSVLDAFSKMSAYAAQQRRAAQGSAEPRREAHNQPPVQESPND